MAAADKVVGLVGYRAGRAMVLDSVTRADPTSYRLRRAGVNGSNDSGSRLYERVHGNRVCPLARGNPGGNTKMDFAWNRILSSFASGHRVAVSCSIVFSFLEGVIACKKAARHFAERRLDVKQFS